MQAQPSGVPIGTQAQYLCAASNVFQGLLLVASNRPVDGAELRRQLSRIPMPTTPFEQLALRCLMSECLMALVAHEPTYRSLKTVREYAQSAAVRPNPKGIAKFSELMAGLCEVDHDPRSLAEAIGDRVEHEYSTRLTIDRMAREFRVSRLQLDRSFSHRFGVRFHEYLRAVRVHRGLDLVMNGMKIEAVAPAVGYKSKKNFYHAVKQVTGLTPGQVRRQKESTARV